jgi:septum formation protein
VRELDRGDPAEVVAENALLKARAARVDGAREAVLGCDTLVSLDGVIYGKPADLPEARATLRTLSGATHEVLSGLALLLPGERERTTLARTAVTFRELDARLLDWYLALGEWRERAGGYAIQGAGAALVRAVRGDYENVVGLPLAALLDIWPELLLACK